MRRNRGFPAQIVERVRKQKLWIYCSIELFGVFLPNQLLLEDKPRGKVSSRNALLSY